MENISSGTIREAVVIKRTNMEYHWELHNPYAQRKKREVPTGKKHTVNGRLVIAYPDNDGGFWYYHPETGRRINIEKA